MAKNIAEKGPQKTPLHVFNRTTRRATGFVSTLEDGKATVASSIEEAVKQASIIFICVGDDRGSLSIIDQIIAAIPKDSAKIVVDCTTVHPDTTKKEDELITSHGAAFVACPVFGGPTFADTGLLVSAVAGPAKIVDFKVKPYLTGVISRGVIDMAGQDTSRASLLKVLGNLFVLSTLESLGEGLVAAEKTGLGIDVYHEWISAFFPGAIAKYAERMVTGDYYKRDEPLVGVDLALKDLGHSISLAKESGTAVRGSQVADRYFRDVKEHSGVKGDVAGVYGAIRKDSGLKFENKA